MIVLKTSRELSIMRKAGKISQKALRLAGEAVEEKGFRITDACIGCGKCSLLCPQQCIQSGTPYAIRQGHCLHCGLCAENCPVQAIVKRGE